MKTSDKCHSESGITLKQTVPEETSLPGIKSSKFKEVVKKVMLDIRMKQLQQKYTQDLSDALENLDQNYHTMRQEAYEKLVMSL